ncbi:Histidine--tRNA ligase [Halomicronema hongdechloris C2206]|uniref:Histidine--tRNA ligase n=1 Tax=Halomicronema hongdechloris C2206 TaxID=1641165 RepID=A0A1Z3HM42_9CYAN|nr:histidine--tRNA ligase [Halomicronema hongdechloris]ASC71355.1 Histidine--tRNA ligase [Halomicronema hongdechloris C2206]
MEPLQSLPGTEDILPQRQSAGQAIKVADVTTWQRIEAMGRDILQRAAYQEIRTPIFELTRLFERGIGEATDVVGKEMYTFLDRGERSVTLRPEGTAGVVRAYVQHKLHGQGGVQRLWYTGPMFRYERPQKGRQRQFHQLGVEVLGSHDPRADVEVIALATDFLQALGLQTLTFHLNSVGTTADRQQYREALVAYFTPYQAELDADSRQRLNRNPLRILDSKDPKTQAIAQDAPSILDYLGPDSQRHFDQVQQYLNDLDIAYDLNPRLVRGLDYYTHTAFEIQSADLGAQATVCGGGRYDGLVEQLGGPATPAVGWAIGLERLSLLLEQLAPPPPNPVDLYLVSRGPAAEAQALRLAYQLRQQGMTTELDLSGAAFGKQFKRADRSGAIACLILGDSEAEIGTVQLKWLQSGEQIQLNQTALVNEAATWRQKLAAARNSQE